MGGYWQDYYDKHFKRAAAPARSFTPQQRQRAEQGARGWENAGAAMPAVGTGLGALIGGLGAGLVTGGMGAGAGAMLGGSIGGALGQGAGGLMGNHGASMREPYEDEEMRRQQQIAALLQALGSAR